MRILVTGHAGYIGTAMVPMAVAAGNDVVGLDSGLFTSCTFEGGTVAVPEIVKDVRDVEVRDLEGFEAVNDHLKRLLAEGRLDASLRWRARPSGA